MCLSMSLYRQKLREQKEITDQAQRQLPKRNQKKKKNNSGETNLSILDKTR